ncbi:hypothetical protein [Piscibacillus salipiscarius]|uniref:hypothetical protein n=1 Tax=Piscibacillus salipiscarius TaxID=299480 RepID=UPI0006D26FA7|nr:hypothetical protein [Piscibacillus salipiscarius]
MFFNNVRATFELSREIEFTEQITINSMDPQDIRFVDQMTVPEYQEWYDMFERKAKSYINQIINQFNPF